MGTHPLFHMDPEESEKGIKQQKQKTTTKAFLHFISSLRSFPSAGHPDMTYEKDWALKANYITYLLPNAVSRHKNVTATNTMNSPEFFT